MRKNDEQAEIRKATANAKSKTSETVERVKRHLEINYAKKITLDELARFAGMNKSRLVRRFHREIGFPPRAFLNRVRVREAQKMLREGLPTVRVALRAGFCDQSHLTRRFKQIVGMTPTEYIEKSKNVQDAPAEAEYDKRTKMEFQSNEHERFRARQNP